MSTNRTLALEDVFTIQNVFDVQVSPDGSQIAFVAGRWYVEGEYKLPASSIWLVPSAGGAEPRQFTYGSHADTSPRWSPDGRNLAFLSDREKADILQIYTMPTAGGEARRLTEAKAGVAQFAWSPDGSRIAYLAPDGDTEEQEQRKKERDDAVHHDHDYKFTRLWVVEAGGGPARAITPPEYQVRNFAWYKNGWAIATTATPLEDDFVQPRPIKQVAEDKPEQLLWQGLQGTYGLTSSSDGQQLAWLHTGADADESVDELWILPAGGEPRRLATDYGGGMMWTCWRPEGNSLLLTSVDSTRTPLGQVSLEGGEITTLIEGRTLGEGFVEPHPVSLSRDGQTMACAFEDGMQTKNVWSGKPGEQLRQVSFFNRHLDEVKLGAVETVGWSAPDGLRIEGVLIYPADYQPGERYPLILHAHGGPTWQWLQRFMLSWHDWGQWLAAHGYAVLLPNPRGSFGRGRDFRYSNRREWGFGDLPDLLSGVDHLVETGLADPDRLGVGGWSYGGYLTAWTIGHTNRFKAAVVGAGVINLLSFQAADIPSWLPAKEMLVDPYSGPEQYLRCSPITYARNITTPTLVLHGECDERVRLGQGRELYNALRHLKIPTEMVTYPRETHFINERHHQRDLLERVVGWYDRWLKPGTADREKDAD